MRRKFELLMKDFWAALNRPEGNGSDVRVAVWGLAQFSAELTREAA